MDPKKIVEEAERTRKAMDHVIQVELDEFQRLEFQLHLVRLTMLSYIMESTLDTLDSLLEQTKDFSIIVNEFKEAINKLDTAKEN